MTQSNLSQNTKNPLQWLVRWLIQDHYKGPILWISVYEKLHFVNGLNLLRSNICLQTYRGRLRKQMPMLKSSISIPFSSWSSLPFPPRKKSAWYWSGASQPPSPIGVEFRVLEPHTDFADASWVWCGHNGEPVFLPAFPDSSGRKRNGSVKGVHRWFDHFFAQQNALPLGRVSDDQVRDKAPSPAGIIEAGRRLPG